MQYDIIIVAGQSNAEGYGIGPVREEYIPDARILMLCDSANAHFEPNENGVDRLVLTQDSPIFVDIAHEPENNGVKTGKLAFTFAQEYVKHGLLGEGRSVLIINAAVGGTGFARNEWGADSVLFCRLQRLLNYALQNSENSKIVAFLWHQGECDSVENASFSPQERYLFYRSNLTEMLRQFHKIYCDDAPFLAGEFCYEWYQKNSVPCNAVLRALREICAKNGCGFVASNGLLSNNQATGNGDDIHFSRESLHILGRRYFTEYMKIIEKNRA